MTTVLKLLCCRCKKKKVSHLFPPSALHEDRASQILCTQCRTLRSGQQPFNKKRRTERFFVVQNALNKMESVHDAKREMRRIETEKLLQARKERLAKKTT